VCIRERSWVKHVLRCPKLTELLKPVVVLDYERGAAKMRGTIGSKHYEKTSEFHLVNSHNGTTGKLIEFFGIR
jgi:hypothetical protein